MLAALLAVAFRFGAQLNVSVGQFDGRAFQGSLSTDGAMHHMSQTVRRAVGELPVYGACLCKRRGQFRVVPGVDRFMSWREG